MGTAYKSVHTKSMSAANCMMGVKRGFGNGAALTAFLCGELVDSRTKSDALPDEANEGHGLVGASDAVLGSAIMQSGRRAVRSKASPGTAAN